MVTSTFMFIHSSSSTYSSVTGLTGVSLTVEDAERGVDMSADYHGASAHGGITVCSHITREGQKAPRLMLSFDFTRAVKEFILID